MLPKKNNNLIEFLSDWMEIKNYDFRGDAGLQLSINSTDNQERDIMFSNSSLTIEEISKIGMNLDFPKGRKITLNFAVANYQVDPEILLEYFDPDDYIIKLTPMHKTKTAIEHDIKTSGNYITMAPYKELEEKLLEAGYDVLVFIASEYEDLGRITCGNAILSGTLPECPYTEGS